jgi:phage shock protein PspC (stress-responsive transcriptional regulator)
VFFQQFQLKSSYIYKKSNKINFEKKFKNDTFVSDSIIVSVNYIISMIKLKYFVEQRAYGVCTRLGEQFGISTASIRLYFVYLSFITVGSPIIIYLVMAFWMNIRRYLRQQNNPSVWEV